ncbi:hypothetical protein AALP_AA4G236600 [Arabis alpina]|uniref:Phytocyanin domain-containing protein n=1 Tax=Arabis alpina TaxID=50452 RepID=A0A087H578_ARAAL|nr:hypothetical protein AALP_AA4G236600 [Arabis alpina]
MAMKMVATALFLVLAIVPAAIAVTHTVGDAQGWASTVDYTVWLTGKTFRVGDKLQFTYGPSHSVNEVNKAGYDSCGGTPISTDNDGDTDIDLETVGTRYFICPTPGHCQSGMKLAVTVVAASGTPATPSPPSSTPGTPATPTTPDSPPAAGTPATPGSPPATGSTTPPPPKGSGASKGVMSYVLVVVSIVFGYGLMM